MRWGPSQWSVLGGHLSGLYWGAISVVCIGGPSPWFVLWVVGWVTLYLLWGSTGPASLWSKLVSSFAPSLLLCFNRLIVPGPDSGEERDGNNYNTQLGIAGGGQVSNVSGKHFVKLVWDTAIFHV